MTQFQRLLKVVRERGGDGTLLGRPWSLPLAERVLVVAVSYRTNLTMRQLGPSVRHLFLPVPTGLAHRRRGGSRGAPLPRTPRTLPRVLGPGEVEAIIDALNTARERGMVLAMLLGGLRSG